METEKKFLSFWKKCAYGSGNMGSDFFYTFASGFVLIYLTDAVGLNPGILGTLMMLSRMTDGVTDVIFGNMLDRTKSKLGKSRFWIIWTILPIAICEVLLFSVPAMNSTLQYVYFFVIYYIVYEVFSVNNIAYETLSMLITANKNERVQLGAFRFVFTMITGVVVSSATIALVTGFGGGTGGWRAVAMIYASLFAIIMFICVLSSKELPSSEFGYNDEEEKEQPRLLETVGYLLRNKYYLLQLCTNISFNLTIVSASSMGIYYATYVLNNPALLGVFTLQAIPMVIGLVLSPMLVKRWGIYKSNLRGLAITLVAGVFYMVFGMKAMVVPMIISACICSFGRGPLVANFNALIAEISEFSRRRDGVRLEGAMFSCAALGMKIGGGLGNALTGWLLTLSRYDGMVDTQPASALLMIKSLYVVLPLIITIVMVLLQSLLKVEKANNALKDTDSGE